MLKYLIIFFSLLFFNTPSYAFLNKCQKCYIKCINTEKYDAFKGEDINKLLKEKKLTIVADKNRILTDSKVDILKNHLFYREGTYFVNQDITLILQCICCKDCQANACQSSTKQP
ncbi:hypothetical protein [Silvanigrella aquatica]|uniref:Uncharacterized protein n=1 Tax=Silvanigrella aquatica TaxID=1915309 RepID=A0A1L4CZP9_9BACT|nr:hypothetical protein [Silvanigrella aquatica]APJ03420.1 hypothetical protein AXG55_05675 [Silvanigrella aquatica]